MPSSRWPPTAIVWRWRAYPGTRQTRRWRRCNQSRLSRWYRRLHSTTTYRWKSRYWLVRKRSDYLKSSAVSVSRAPAGMTSNSPSLSFFSAFSWLLTWDGGAVIYVVHMETSVKSAYHSVLCVLPHILVDVGTGNLSRKFVSLASWNYSEDNVKKLLQRL